MDRMTHKKASRPPIIALYQPDIPQNTASIIRTCSCFGLKVEIIEPCGFSLEDKRFKRVVMDYYNKKMIKPIMNINGLSTLFFFTVKISSSLANCNSK